MKYVPVSGYLASLSLTLEGGDRLFGLSQGFTLRAHGTHTVFPYNTGGSTFNTSSSEKPSLGVFSYQGMLAGNLDVLRDEVFAKLGVIQSKMRLKIFDPASEMSLYHADLYGYRLNQITMTSALFGHTGIVQGSFAITFRKAVVLPF